MYKTITIDKYSDLSEAQWKKYYDFRLLLDERVNTQTPFKSFSQLKEIMPNSFNDKGRLVVISVYGEFGQLSVGDLGIIRCKKTKCR